MKVAVIGVGTVGVQTAYHLAARGVDVVGYEQYSIGHGGGSAGGDSRLFSKIELKDPRYSRVIERAEQLWRDLNERTAAPLLTITGGLVMGDPSIDAVRRGIEACESTSKPEALSPEDLERRYPEVFINPGEVALLDPSAGRIDPELSITMTARLAEATGAELRRESEVEAIERRAEGIAVRSAGEWEIYDRVVVAAGAWTRKLLGGKAPNTEVRRLTSAWHFPSNAARFDTMVPFIRLLPDYIYGLPAADGRSIKVGLGFDSHLPVDDPDDVARWVEPGTELDAFRPLVQKYLPGLDPDPFRVETYFETYTPSRREYVAPFSEDDRVLIATGFSGHGFKVAPAIGEAIADWAQDREPRYPLDLFERGEER